MAASIDAKLARLKVIALEPVDEIVAKELSSMIAGVNIYVAAQAAKVAADRAVRSLAPLMGEALKKALDKPAKDDKGCLGKTKMAEALNALDFFDEELFLRGVRHVQKEPSYGGDVDTAANLRCQCAMGLVRSGKPADVLRILADMLFEAEPTPRDVAAKNLGFAMMSDAAEMLLRAKVHAGDTHFEVIESCFAGLLNIAPNRYHEFVGEYVTGSNNDLASAAAMALAMSRDKARASAFLLECYGKTFYGSQKEMLLTPIAITRTKEAFSFLMGVIEIAPTAQALAAVRAMACFAPTGDDAAKILQAVDKRDDRALTAEYERVIEKRH